MKKRREPDNNPAVSFQELKQLSRPESSVGRGEIVTAFVENLERAPVMDGHKFVYNVFGQGGTGKTWLLRAFIEAAAGADALTAWSDENEEDALAILRKLVADLDPLDRGFGVFLKEAARYAKLVHEALTDDEAPSGVAAYLGYAAGRGALALGRQVPGLGLALEFADPEAVGSASASAVAYLASRFRDSGDLELLTRPLEVLSKLFVEGLHRVSPNKPVVLGFDTYERTQPYLEEWLQAVLAGRFGDTPASLVVAVAGQVPLSYSGWSENEPWTERIPLDVFSDDEARALLRERAVTDDAIVAEVLRLSNRLPVLLAALASQSPRTAAAIGDVTGTAVDVFLKWIEDEELREAAIGGALPRVLSQDTLAAVTGTDVAQRYLDPLLAMPFVEERAGGWAYHPVVRAQFLRHLHHKSPQEWSKAQHELHAYFAEMARAIVASVRDSAAVGDAEWQRYEVEHVYHALCEGSGNLERVVSNVIHQSDTNPAFIENLCLAVVAAGDDRNDARLGRWGRMLLDYVTGVEFEQLYASLTAMLESRSPRLGNGTRAILHRRRGVLLGTNDQLDEALADFTTAATLSPEADREFLIDQAVTLLLKGDASSARDVASSALARLNDERLIGLRVSALGVRGSAHAMLDDNDGAVADFTAALAVAPSDAEILRRRAGLFADRNEVEAAIGDLRMAIAADADFAHSGMQRIGAIYCDAGRDDEAKAALLESLDLEPDCGHCWTLLIELAVRRREDLAQLRGRALEGRLSAEGRARRARAFAEAGAYADALIDLEQAMTDGSVSLALQNERGIYLANSGRRKEAVSVYRDVLVEEPAFLPSAYNLAVLLALENDQEGSVAAWQMVEEAASEYDPVIVVYARAGMSAAQGDVPASLDALRAAWELEPDVVSECLATDIAWSEVRELGEFRAITAQG